MVRFAAAAIALVTSLVGLSASGGQIMLLNFSRRLWTCRQMEPLIQRFEQAGYPIRKVDTSASRQVAQQYNVTRFPTFVMLVDGREINRNVGKHRIATSFTQMFQQAKAMAGRRDNRGQSQVPQLPSQQPPRADRPAPEPQATCRPTRSQSFSAQPSASASMMASTLVRHRNDHRRPRRAKRSSSPAATCSATQRAKAPSTSRCSRHVDGRVRAAGQVSGWVLSYDLDRDVALVVIRPGRPVTVAPIAPARIARRARRSRGQHRLQQRRRSDRPARRVSRRSIDTRDRPTSRPAGAPVEGRSGGGLFNEKGELIGVCYAADYEGNEGLYAALESIHDEVVRLNLFPSKDESEWGPTEGTPRIANDDKLVRQDPVVRGQDNPSPVMPQPNREPITPVGAVTTVGPSGLPSEKPAGLNQAEQAAWDEIIKRRFAIRSDHYRAARRNRAARAR